MRGGLGQARIIIPSNSNSLISIFMLLLGSVESERSIINKVHDQLYIRLAFTNSFIFRMETVITLSYIR